MLEIILQMRGKNYCCAIFEALKETPHLNPGLRIKTRSRFIQK